MSRNVLMILLSGLFLGAIACGGGGNPTAQQPDDGNNDVNNDVNNDAPNNDAPNNDAPNNDPNNDAPEDPFSECDGAGDCQGGAACMEGVCVPNPTGVGAANYERDSRVVAHPDGPNLECYANPTPLGDEVQYVEARGEIEKFGVGGSTVGLCVTIYNRERFMADRATRCAEVANDPLAYEECLEIDPCRCEKDFEGDQDSIDDCFNDIGYCHGIQGENARAACTQEWAFDGANANRDAAIESTLIYGHMIATLPPGRDQSDQGYFAIPNVPTHTNIVIKVSGKKARWIDTYEFGPVLSDVRDDNGTAFSGWGGNVISIGAWQTIPSTALVPSGIQAGNGAIAGRVNDCGQEGRTIMFDGEERDASAPMAVSNATLGLTHDATRITYFNGNPDDTLPQPDRTTTNVLAVYAAINAPGGFNRVSTAVRTSEGGELVSTGIRDIFMAPRSVSIVTFEGSWLPAAW